MNDRARYCVMLPSGREGPFTVEELRHLVETRKINADDRIFDTATKKAQSVCDLVPDHLALTDSSLQPALPQPVVEPAIPAPAPAPPVAVEAAPPAARKPGVWILVAVIVLALGVLLAILL